jgi:hypothetical protein
LFGLDILLPSFMLKEQDILHGGVQVQFAVLDENGNNEKTQSKFKNDEKKHISNLLHRDSLRVILTLSEEFREGFKVNALILTTDKIIENDKENNVENLDTPVDLASFVPRDVDSLGSLSIQIKDELISVNIFPNMDSPTLSSWEALSDEQYNQIISSILKKLQFLGFSQRHYSSKIYRSNNEGTCFQELGSERVQS